MHARLLLMVLFAFAQTPEVALAQTPAAAASTEDQRRHGPEIVAFAGVKPGDTVIDLIPGSGYWTRLFVRAVGPSGHVYGIWPAPYAAEAASDVRAYRSLAGSDGARQVTLLIEPATELRAPRKADVIFTAQNYHDYPDKFMGRIAPAAFLREVWNALKPGGVFVVIDHAALPGTGMRATDTLHRIEEATVRDQAKAAGFRLAATSDLLRNPADDRTRPVFDRAVRGRTDQFILKFVKPAH